MELRRRGLPEESCGGVRVLRRAKDPRISPWDSSLKAPCGTFSTIGLSSPEPLQEPPTEASPAQLGDAELGEAELLDADLIVMQAPRPPRFKPLIVRYLSPPRLKFDIAFDAPMLGDRELAGKKATTEWCTAAKEEAFRKEVYEQVYVVLLPKKANGVHKELSSGLESFMLWEANECLRDGHGLCFLLPRTAGRGSD